MALLLIMAANRSHIDPIKDARGVYKRGDIVDVYNDDKHDGDLIANPIAEPFVLVRVRGLSVDEAQRYLQPDLVPRLDPVVGAVLDTRTRRRFRLRVDDIPVSTRNQLLTTRYADVSRAAVISYLRDKVTGLDEV